MALSSQQQGVIRGMASGGAIAIGIVSTGIWLNPLGYDPGLSSQQRLTVAAQSLLVPAIFLAFSIAKLAKHRFFTPENIDGGGLQRGSERAILLQSLLQNTLEQAVLASLAYASWAAIMPTRWLSVLPMAALSFGIGRALFFAGYREGAPSRALGFAMTFYPSALMLLCLVLFQLSLL
jgi:hypothetical protein